MAFDIGSGVLDLSVRLNRFNSRLAQAKKTTQGFIKQSKVFGLKIGEMNKTLGPLARGLAVVGRASLVVAKKLVTLSIVGVAAVGALAAKASIAFASFQTSMTSIGAMLGDFSAGTFEVVSSKLIGISTKFGASIKDLTGAMYDLTSAQMSVEESMDVMRAGMTLARAGVVDLNQATGAITSVVRGYGLSTEYVRDISDVFFQTVKLGRTTLEQLQAQIGNLIPTASTVGVSFDKLGVLLATLTQAGIKTDEAVTALDRALYGLAAPSDEAAEAIEELGLRTTNARGELVGMVGILEQFQGMTLSQVREVIPEKRAAKAILALTRNLDLLSEGMEKMRDRSGAAEEASGKFANTLSVVWKRVKATLSSIFLTLGENIKNVTKNILNSIGALGKYFENLVEEHGPKINQMFSTLYGALKKLAVAAGTFIKSFLEGGGINFIKDTFYQWTVAIRGAIEAIFTLLIPIGHLVQILFKLAEVLTSVLYLFGKIPILKIFTAIPRAAGQLSDLAGGLANGAKEALNLSNNFEKAKEAVREFRKESERASKAGKDLGEAPIRRGEPYSPEPISGISGTTKEFNKAIDEATKEFEKKFSRAQERIKQLYEKEAVALAARRNAEATRIWAEKNIKYMEDAREELDDIYKKMAERPDMPSVEELRAGEELSSRQKLRTKRANVQRMKYLRDYLKEQREEFKSRGIAGPTQEALDKLIEAEKERQKEYERSIRVRKQAESNASEIREAHLEYLREVREKQRALLEEGKKEREERRKEEEEFANTKEETLDRIEAEGLSIEAVKEHTEDTKEAIEDKEDALEKATKEFKFYNKQYEEGKIAEEEYRKETSRLRGEIEDLKEEKRRLTAENEAYEESLEVYEEEKEKVEEVIDEYSKYVNELEDYLDEATDKYKDYQEDIKDIQDSLEDYQKSYYERLRDIAWDWMEKPEKFKAMLSEAKKIYKRGKEAFESGDIGEARERALESQDILIDALRDAMRVREEMKELRRKGEDRTPEEDKRLRELVDRYGNINKVIDNIRDSIRNLDKDIERTYEEQKKTIKEKMEDVGRKINDIKGRIEDLGNYLSKALCKALGGLTNKQLPEVEKGIDRILEKIRKMKTEIGSIEKGVGGEGTIPGMASGGWVKDNLLARLSHGEFVMNRDAAQRFGPMLEAMNKTNNVSMNFPNVRGVDRETVRRVIAPELKRMTKRGLV